jgi:PhzF family phenazine biosynthesis protein
MPAPIYQVDAFTDRPFAGNPAAVCLLSGPADADWMLHVAMEMNLSEPAFLHHQGDVYRLRWFTPRSKSICAAMPHLRALTSSGSKVSSLLMLKLDFKHVADS